MNHAEEREEGLNKLEGGFQGHHREHTETTDLGSQELTETGPTARKPAWDQPKPSTYV